MRLHLAYHTEKTKLSVRDDVFEVKPFQIIFWVSVTPAVFGDWHRDMPRFPAILDIGNNHNLAITKDQLTRWAGISIHDLSTLKNIRVERRTATLFHSNLWLHSDSAPFQLMNDDGIAVLDGDWPRLPILGLRTLTNSKLQLFIFGDKTRALILTPPPWYWPF